MASAAVVANQHHSQVCSRSVNNWSGTGCCVNRLMEQETCGSVLLCNALTRQFELLVEAGMAEIVDLTEVPDDCIPGTMDLAEIKDILIVNTSCDDVVTITLPPSILDGAEFDLEPGCYFAFTSNTGWAADDPWQITVDNSSGNDVLVKISLATTA